MKKAYCKYCSREREVEDNVVNATCPCGNSFEFKNETSKDDQVILKSIFQRGVKRGRLQTAEDIIFGCNTKIKVNLK